MVEGQQRIEFAHMLRGFAAVSVVLGHYCGVFFLLHPAIANLMGLPAIEGLELPGWPISMIADYSTLLGQFGVGVFFIISGFVIPFSLARNSAGRFLVQRALRIYPVYIAGFSIVILAVWLANRFSGTPFPYGFWHVISHFGVLTRDLFNYSRIDGISWTLEVELTFYIVAGIIGARLTRFGGRALVAIATALLFAGIGVNVTRGIALGEQYWAALLLVLGVAYHSSYIGVLSKRGLIGMNVYIAILIGIEWPFTHLPLLWVSGYWVAIAVFSCCYLARDRIMKIRILSHFADISYPLYVVHCLTGYALMYVMIRSGAPAPLAVVAALLAAYLLAVAIHVLVEKPAMRFAKKGRFGPRLPPIPAAP